MKKYIAPLLALGLSTTALAEYRVVGYVPDYRTDMLSSIDWAPVTHVMASFLNPNTKGVFKPSAGLREVITAAKAQSHIKVYVSIGGAAVPGNWATMMNSTNRAATAKAIADTAAALGVAGVDVDLEGSLVQSADYNPFCAELYTALNAKGLKMTAAVAKWTAGSIADSTLNKFEFINLMAYDYTGPWETAGNHAHSTIKMAQTELSYYANSRKVPADKIVLGVPFYGYDFADLSNVTEFLWSDIVSSHPEAMDQDSLVIAGEAKYYNGRRTIHQKAIMGAPYGGVMIWELGQDVYDVKANSLLEQIRIVKDSLANPGTTAVKSIVIGKYNLGQANTPWSLSNSLGQTVDWGTSSPEGTVSLRSGLSAGRYFLKSGNSSAQEIQLN